MSEAYALIVLCRRQNHLDIDHNVRSWSGLNDLSYQSNSRVVGIDPEVVVGYLILGGGVDGWLHLVLSRRWWCGLWGDCPLMWKHCVD